MKITILGSGTMFPTKKRLPSAFLLESGSKKILLDCGHGTLARLASLDIDLRSIDAVFISHFHIDHFGDAFPLVNSCFVGDIYEHKNSHQPLIFLGPRTLQERFNQWRKIYWVEPQEMYPLKFCEGEFEYTLGDIRLSTFSIKHVSWFESVGIRVNVGDKIIVYPGDVGAQHGLEDLIKKSDQADLLLIKAGYEKPTPNHFTLEQIEELAHRSSVKKVIIVHIRHIIGEEERLRRFIQDKPNFYLAEDLMEIEL